MNNETLFLGRNIAAHWAGSFSDADDVELAKLWMSIAESMENEQIEVKGGHVEYAINQCERSIKQCKSDIKSEAKMMLKALKTRFKEQIGLDYKELMKCENCGDEFEVIWKNSECFVEDCTCDKTIPKFNKDRGI